MFPHSDRVGEEEREEEEKAERSAKDDRRGSHTSVLVAVEGVREGLCHCAGLSAEDYRDGVRHGERAGLSVGISCGLTGQ